MADRFFCGSCYYICSQYCKTTGGSCILDKDPDFPVIAQSFDSVTPNMEISGAISLPAPSNGYSGPGACVEEIGSNCITMEPSALGCPYEPDECSEVYNDLELTDLFNRYYIHRSVLNLC